MRHAKAEQRSYADDFHRKLASKGFARMEDVVAQLAQTSFSADHILCSAASRTEQTAHFLQKNSFPKSSLSSLEKLYLCGEEQYWDSMFEQDKAIQNLVIVGHNPGIHEFANTLSPKVFPHFKTAAYAAFSFDINAWNEATPQNGKLLFCSHEY